jgi:hypothetical protein
MSLSADGPIRPPRISQMTRGSSRQFDASEANNQGSVVAVLNRRRHPGLLAQSKTDLDSVVPHACYAIPRRSASYFHPITTKIAIKIAKRAIDDDQSVELSAEC